MQYILCFIGLLFLSQAIQADTYRYEINLDYGEADGDFLEEESVAIDGTLYFSPVEDSKGPLAEAAFISRASSVTLSYRESDTEDIAIPLGVTFFVPTQEPAPGFIADPFPNFASIINDPEPFSPVTSANAPKSNREDVLIAIAGQLIFPESGWFVSIAVSQSEGDGTWFISKQDIDNKGYYIGAGRYLFETTTLSVNYGNEQIDSKRQRQICGISTFENGFFCAAEVLSVLEEEMEIETWGISFKHLANIGDLHFSVHADYRHTSTDIRFKSSGAIIPSSSFDDERTYRLGATIYPTSSLGINLNYALSDQGDLQTDTYGASVSWFFTRSIGISGVFNRIEPESSSQLDLDINAYSISLTARF